MTDPMQVIVTGIVALPLPSWHGRPEDEPKVLTEGIDPDGTPSANVDAPVIWWRDTGWIAAHKVAWRLRIDGMDLPPATKRALLQLADDAEPDS